MTHSARLDDEMAAETEALTRGAPVPAHAEEWRLAEPAADGEPGPESVVGFIDDASLNGLGANEVRLRSELAAALPGHAFPGDRGVLLHAAEGEHAPEWIIEALRRLPIDTRFDTPQAVWLALGGHRETRATGAGAPPVEEPEAVPVPPPEPHPEPEPPPPSPLPSPPPPGLDLVGRVTGLVGAGIGLAGAVVGGTLDLARRVVGSVVHR